MTALVDLTGQTFGDWTVIRAGKYRARGEHTYWVCRCVCGTERSVRGDTLRKGSSRSCAVCANERLVALNASEGRTPPVTRAATTGYSYEPRLNGRYFAVLRHTLWRGRAGTTFVVGYDNEADARALVTELSLRKHKEGPRPE